MIFTVQCSEMHGPKHKEIVCSTIYESIVLVISKLHDCAAILVLLFGLARLGKRALKMKKVDKTNLKGISADNWPTDYQ